jgi:hypothetical protein
VSQRIVRDISSADKKLVQQLLGVATLAARAGNIALAAGICTRLLGACCSDDVDLLFCAQPACTSLPLFPPGLPSAVLDRLYAPPQPKFYPATDPTVRQDRQNKSDAMNKARVFDTSLDSVLVALVASPAARKSPLFAAAVAHIAFAQIRIVMCTRRDRSGAQFTVAASGITHALEKAIVAAKPRVEAHRAAMTPMDTQNLKFLCTAEAAIHTFYWQKRREALLSPQFPGDVVHMVPASCAFLFWFIHDALSTQVRRRIDAGTSSLCDASFLSARVMEFLLDMP